MCEFGLNQEILMEYLDGVADVSIAAHIVGCRHCRDGVIMLANAQSKFREMVSPLLCVDEMRLGEYYLGTLGMDASLAVNLHVQVCEHCRARLDAISSFTDGKARSPEILYPLLSQSPASHGVGAVRNGGFRQRKELTYFIHEAEINLEIEKAGKDFAIWGLVTGIEGKRLLNASLKSVEQTDQDDQSADIDNLGNFQFMDVENGGYDLMIVADDISFLLRGITVSAFNV